MRKRRKRMINLQCYNINPDMGQFRRVMFTSATLVRVSFVPIFCSALQKSRLFCLPQFQYFCIRIPTV
jgi:hypothetical protein